MEKCDLSGFCHRVDAANGMFLVENRFDFLEASGEAELCYEIKAGGSAQDETVILADGTKECHICCRMRKQS